MKIVKTIRPVLLEFFTHKLAVPTLYVFRKKSPFHYTMSDLEQFPEGTLGKDLATHLKANHFTLLKHYERHDCKHIILGFPMNELGEASMQFYFLGARHYSIAVLITVAVCLFIMPEHWSTFSKEFKRGRKGKRMNHLNFNELVHLKTIDLQHEYQISTL